MINKHDLTLGLIILFGGNGALFFGARGAVLGTIGGAILGEGIAWIYRRLRNDL